MNIKNHGVKKYSLPNMAQGAVLKKDAPTHQKVMMDWMENVYKMLAPTLKSVAALSMTHGASSAAAWKKLLPQLEAVVKKSLILPKDQATEKAVAETCAKRLELEYACGALMAHDFLTHVENGLEAHFQENQAYAQKKWGDNLPYAVKITLQRLAGLGLTSWNKGRNSQQETSYLKALKKYEATVAEREDNKKEEEPLPFWTSNLARSEHSWGY